MWVDVDLRGRVFAECREPGDPTERERLADVTKSQRVIKHQQDIARGHQSDLSGKSELFSRQGACDNPELSRRVTPVVCRRYCTALAVFSRIIAIRPRS